MNESEKTEDRLSLRQADAARADLYAIHDELDHQGADQPVADPQRPRPDRPSFAVGRGGACDCRRGVANPALSLTAEAAEAAEAETGLRLQMIS